jgi:hypothetical protein
VAGLRVLAVRLAGCYLAAEAVALFQACFWLLVPVTQGLRCLMLELLPLLAVLESHRCPMLQLLSCLPPSLQGTCWPAIGVVVPWHVLWQVACHQYAWLLLVCQCLEQAGGGGLGWLLRQQLPHVPCLAVLAPRWCLHAEHLLERLWCLPTIAVLARCWCLHAEHLLQSLWCLQAHLASAPSPAPGTAAFPGVACPVLVGGSAPVAAFPGVACPVLVGGSAPVAAFHGVRCAVPVGGSAPVAAFPGVGSPVLVGGSAPVAPGVPHPGCLWSRR